MNAPNIYLIGLMGSGKTTLGKSLAKKLNRPFIDTDQLIEQKSGVDVSMIFEFEGEVGFRERETKLLSEIALKKEHIVSTGGGIILSKYNRDVIAKSGIIFYLKTQPAELFIRLQNDKTRPLLQGTNLKEKLTKIYAERCTLYEMTADYIIETKNKKISQILTNIEEIMTAHENHKN
jgi:shikimate kinase